MLPTPINITLYGWKNWSLAKPKAYRMEPDAPQENSRHYLTNLCWWPDAALTTWMKLYAPVYNSSKHSNYAWMFEHFWWPHGMEFVPHWESVELRSIWYLDSDGWVARAHTECVMDPGEIWISVWCISAGRTHVLSWYSTVSECCS